jgi:hypothetical protein
MSFAWRREDSGYLVAALLAAVLVVFIVFGNFGLLPSPFAAPDAEPAIIAAIEPVVAAAAPADVEITPVAAPPTAEEPRPRVGGPPATDGSSPAVSFTTESGTSFGLAQPAFVEGVVEDLGSGVDTVLVTFTSTTGTAKTVAADLTCNEARTTCIWRADVPAAVAAGYTVSAEALDRAGNVALSDTLDVTVVNPAGTLEQVGGVVERVPNVVNKLVGGVLGILGN